VTLGDELSRLAQLLIVRAMSNSGLSDCLRDHGPELSRFVKFPSQPLSH
jgi:hypothetical protein